MVCYAPTGGERTRRTSPRVQRVSSHECALTRERPPDVDPPTSNNRGRSIALLSCRLHLPARGFGCGLVGSLEELQQHGVGVMGGAYGWVGQDELAELGVEPPGDRLVAMAHTESIFETARLRARPMDIGDLETFVAYRADPEVARFQSWSNYSLEDGRALLASLEGHRLGAPGEWYQLALEKHAGGGLVGDLASKVNESEPREMEVGFTLAPAHQGKGFGTEALRGLLDLGFGTLGLHRVVAVTDALNAPAAALLERVGMRREAHFLENVFFKGAWGSEFLFAILDHEWGTRRESSTDSA